MLTVSRSQQDNINAIILILQTHSWTTLTDYAHHPTIKQVLFLLENLGQDWPLGPHSQKRFKFEENWMKLK